MNRPQNILGARHGRAIWVGSLWLGLLAPSVQAKSPSLGQGPRVWRAMAVSRPLEDGEFLRWLTRETGDAAPKVRRRFELAAGQSLQLWLEQYQLVRVVPAEPKSRLEVSQLWVSDDGSVAELPTVPQQTSDGHYYFRHPRWSRGAHRIRCRSRCELRIETPRLRQHAAYWARMHRLVESSTPTQLPDELALLEQFDIDSSTPLAIDRAIARSLLAAPQFDELPPRLREAWRRAVTTIWRAATRARLRVLEPRSAPSLRKRRVPAAWEALATEKITLAGRPHHFHRLEPGVLAFDLEGPATVDFEARALVDANFDPRVDPPPAERTTIRIRRDALSLVERELSMHADEIPETDAARAMLLGKPHTSSDGQALTAAARIRIHVPPGRHRHQLELEAGSALLALRRLPHTPDTHDWLRRKHAAREFASVRKTFAVLRNKSTAPVLDLAERWTAQHDGAPPVRAVSGAEYLAPKLAASHALLTARRAVEAHPADLAADLERACRRLRGAGDRSDGDAQSLRIAIVQTLAELDERDRAWACLGRVHRDRARELRAFARLVEERPGLSPAISLARLQAAAALDPTAPGLAGDFAFVWSESTRWRRLPVHDEVIHPGWKWVRTYDSIPDPSEAERPPDLHTPKLWPVPPQGRFIVEVPGDAEDAERGAWIRLTLDRQNPTPIDLEIGELERRFPPAHAPIELALPPGRTRLRTQAVGTVMHADLPLFHTDGQPISPRQTDRMWPLRHLDITTEFQLPAARERARIRIDLGLLEGPKSPRIIRIHSDVGPAIDVVVRWPDRAVQRPGSPLRGAPILVAKASWQLDLPVLARSLWIEVLDMQGQPTPPGRNLVHSVYIRTGAPPLPAPSKADSNTQSRPLAIAPPPSATRGRAHPRAVPIRRLKLWTQEFDRLEREGGSARERRRAHAKLAEAALALSRMGDARRHLEAWLRVPGRAAAQDWRLAEGLADELSGAVSHRYIDVLDPELRARGVVVLGPLTPDDLTQYDWRELLTRAASSKRIDVVMAALRAYGQRAEESPETPIEGAAVVYGTSEALARRLHFAELRAIEQTAARQSQWHGVDYAHAAASVAWLEPDPNETSSEWVEVESALLAPPWPLTDEVGLLWPGRRTSVSFRRDQPGHAQLEIFCRDSERIFGSAPRRVQLLLRLGAQTPELLSLEHIEHFRRRLALPEGDARLSVALDSPFKDWRCAVRVAGHSRDVDGPPTQRGPSRWWLAHPSKPLELQVRGPGTLRFKVRAEDRPRAQPLHIEHFVTSAPTRVTRGQLELVEVQTSPQGQSQPASIQELRWVIPEAGTHHIRVTPADAAVWMRVSLRKDDADALAHDRPPSTLRRDLALREGDRPGPTRLFGAWHAPHIDNLPSQPNPHWGTTSAESSGGLAHVVELEQLSARPRFTGRVHWRKQLVRHRLWAAISGFATRELPALPAGGLAAALTTSNWPRYSRLHLDGRWSAQVVAGRTAFGLRARFEWAVPLQLTPTWQLTPSIQTIVRGQNQYAQDLESQFEGSMDSWVYSSYARTHAWSLQPALRAAYRPLRTTTLASEVSVRANADLRSLDRLDVDLSLHSLLGTGRPQRGQWSGAFSLELGQRFADAHRARAATRFGIGLDIHWHRWIRPLWRLGIGVGNTLAFEIPQTAYAGTLQLSLDFAPSRGLLDFSPRSTAFRELRSPGWETRR